jgi:bifunctional DNA-binding transcriptional regulator/antitoxin component of YhaV-PrlF toxin-antitoxin module
MQTFIPEKISKLQPRGILTIPKKFRLELNMTDNTLVKIKKEGYRLIIEPVKTLSYPVRSYSQKEINEFIDFDKKEVRKLK